MATRGAARCATGIRPSCRPRSGRVAVRVATHRERHLLRLLLMSPGSCPHPSCGSSQLATSPHWRLSTENVRAQGLGPDTGTTRSTGGRNVSPGPSSVAPSSRPARVLPTGRREHLGPTVGAASNDGVLTKGAHCDGCSKSPGLAGPKRRQGTNRVTETCALRVVNCILWMEALRPPPWRPTIAAWYSSGVGRVWAREPAQSLRPRRALVLPHLGLGKAQLCRNR